MVLLGEGLALILLLAVCPGCTFDCLRQGSQWVSQWMQTNCRVSFVVVKDDGEGASLSNALSDFTKFVAEQFGPDASKNVFLDC